MSFYLESRARPVSGDNVVNLGDYVGAPVPFPGTNLRQYEASLQRIAAMEYDVACLSHGQVFRANADRRIRRMVEWHLAAPAWLRLARVMPQGLSAGQAERASGRRRRRRL